MGTDETAIGANARNQWRARGVHCSFQSFLRDGELSLHARMKHAEEGDGAASLDHRLTTMGRREINIEAAVSRCSGMPEYVFVHPEDPISDARSEERRVRKEWVSKCRSRGTPYN